MKRFFAVLFPFDSPAYNSSKISPVVSNSTRLILVLATFYISSYGA